MAASLQIYTNGKLLIEFISNLKQNEKLNKQKQYKVVKCHSVSYFFSINANGKFAWKKCNICIYVYIYTKRKKKNKQKWNQFMFYIWAAYDDLHHKMKLITESKGPAFLCSCTIVFDRNMENIYIVCMSIERFESKQFIHYVRDRRRSIK